VFTPETGIPPGFLRQTAQAAEAVIRRHADDILSLAAIEEYFSLYYWTKGDTLDENGILASLQVGCKNGDFPFKTVAEKFRFISDEMKPVVIPFDAKAKRLINALNYHEKPLTLSRELQKYTVSIYPREWDRLLDMGSIELTAGIFPILLDETLYRNDIGLCADNPLNRDAESLII
jgi:CRISPR-associated endonuclease/helicase Cas3